MLLHCLNTCVQSEEPNIVYNCSGRYQIFSHPQYPGLHTFLIDTETGKVWRMVEDPETKATWFMLLTVEDLHLSTEDILKNIEIQQQNIKKQQRTDFFRAWYDNLSPEFQKKFSFTKLRPFNVPKCNASGLLRL